MPAESRARWLRLTLAFAGTWLMVLVSCFLLVGIADRGARAWLPFLAAAYIFSYVGLTAIGKRMARAERERRETIGEPPPSTADRVQARRDVRNHIARLALGTVTIMFLSYSSSVQATGLPRLSASHCSSCCSTSRG